MKRENPLVKQSKQWMIKALLELMLEKPYSDIKINELTDKAQLSRKTFYRNFKVKDDILKEYINYLFNEYLDYLKRSEIHNYSDVLIIYFTFWNKHIDILKLLKKNHLFYMVMEHETSFIPYLNDINTPWHNYSSDVDAKYLLLFCIGGLWNVLSDWIENPHRESPQNIAYILQKNINNLKNI